MSQNVQSRKYVLLLLRGSLYLLVNIMLVIVIIYGTFICAVLDIISVMAFSGQ